MGKENDREKRKQRDHVQTNIAETGELEKTGELTPAVTDH